MNDQSQMMSQQAIMMNQAPPPQVMGKVQVQPQILNQSQLMTHSQAMNQPMNPAQMAQSQPMSGAQMMNQPPLMMNRTYKPWPQDAKPNFNMKFSSLKPNFANSSNRSNNWKGKKISTMENRRMEKFEKPMMMAGGAGGSGVGPGSTQGYIPPALNDLQYQNRLKARKFYNKKKFNNGRFAPYAPRNTTSFIIRAKKSGGIASLVSPYPVTPAVLPTPVFSPSTEVLGDMAKEEWGVDGYGSMKGLIRLRSPGNNDPEVVHDDEEDEEGNGGGSSESDVEEHVEVERRLDHDLSRFEMIYPSYGGGSDYNNLLENRVDDQDTHIAQLEEENLMLKERLFIMERELGDLRKRLQFLERQTQVVEDVNEEVVENGSDNENESDTGGSDIRLTGGDDAAEMIEFVAANEGGRNIRNVDLSVKGKKQNYDLTKNEDTKDVCMKEFVPQELTVKENEKKTELGRDDQMKVEAVRSEITQREIFGEKEDGTKGEGTRK